MGRYFQWGFEEAGHETYSVGMYSHGKIPWGETYYYPHYKMPPDFELPDYNVPLKEVLNKIDFTPDIVFQAGDTQFLTGPSPIPNLIYATDPHAVNYTERRDFADYFFNAQNCYKQEKDIWIPYGYSEDIHIPISDTEIIYDVAMSGLLYPHRVEAMQAMQTAGLSMYITLGAIYHDYAKVYAKSKIAFVYSSKNDLPARFWEGLAMKKMVLTNRVPDLKLLDFVEGQDYVAFDTVQEAVEKAAYYANHDAERERIAESGFMKVQPHTYKARCEQILSHIKL